MSLRYNRFLTLLTALLCVVVFVGRSRSLAQSEGLPSKAYTSLKAKIPDFVILQPKDYAPQVQKLFKRNPGVVAGYFNEDKLLDYSIIGYSEKHKKFYILGLIAQPDGKQFALKTVEQWTLDNSNRGFPLSKYLTKGKPKILGRHTFQVESFGPGLTGVDVYYFSEKTESVQPFMVK